MIVPLGKKIVYTKIALKFWCTLDPPGEILKLLIPTLYLILRKSEV